MPKKQSQLDAITSVVDADEMNVEQSGTSKRIPVGLVQTQLPFNYIGGLITSNNGGDPAKDIDIAPGEARDNTNVDNMRLAAAITKQIDAIWAVGTDQGGLDTGAVAADTLYAVWLIKRSDTGVVDALFSTSFTAPTMPTNYDRKRLIGAINTDGTPDILPYEQTGDFFRYTTLIPEVIDTTITDVTWETATLHVPPNAMAEITASLTNPTSTSAFDGRLWIRKKGAADGLQTPRAFMLIEATGNFDQMARKGRVQVDGSSQMEYAAAETTGSATVEIRTIGFTMCTRREP
jgi:hypothetical protein